MKTILLVGAGGHGQTVAEVLQLLNDRRVVGFLDDAYPMLSELFSLPILGKIGDLPDFIGKVDGFFVAIGNNSLREKICNDIRALGGKLESVLHPSATISPTAQIGGGVAVMAGAVIGTRTEIGDGVIVNLNSCVDHHCVLGDFSHLGVGVSLAGGVKVGHAAWLQAGCSAGYDVCVESNQICAPGTVLSV